MIEIVPTVYASHSIAIITFPDADKLVSYARHVNIREPRVDDVVAFADGMSLPAQYSDDPLEKIHIAAGIIKMCF